MSTMFGFAPLWRSTIGFDQLFDALDRVASVGDAAYPPYDIEKTGEDRYRLTLALAGWMPEEISVTTEPDLLVVAGAKKGDADGAEFLYRGIPAGSFERRFSLTEYVEVTGARFENGLLTIDLVRQMPEAMKPHRIAIADGNQPQAIENKAAA
jgi:molecular chaperone IbpA